MVNLSDSNIVVSAEELRKPNLTSVELRDKSGYFGSLDVFHQLHCLVSVTERTIIEL